MAACMWTSGLARLRLLSGVRYGHHIRGKPPGVARTLQDRLDEMNYKDPALHFKVNIGLPHLRASRRQEFLERLHYIKKKKTPDFEKLSRTRQLLIDLDEAKRDWEKTCGPFQIKTIAEHYGIYDDLFGDAYFVPRVMLRIAYDYDKDWVTPVHRGNLIKPAEAKEAPSVHFDAEPDSLWTLVLTNPDGHFSESNAEYLHWFRGNIRGSDMSTGEDVCHYLQPFPAKGAGFHRFVFILYKQDSLVDFSKWKRPSPCFILSDRTFHTLDFYRELQDVLTPAGLAFFQSDWDNSLTHFFHNTLNMQEPIFEYDFPPQYIKPQEWFPIRKAFNLYLDKYKDPKDIQKELLLIKLKELHPFKGPQARPKYPNIFHIPDSVPSWLKNEMMKERLRLGKYKDI